MQQQQQQRRENGGCSLGTAGAQPGVGGLPWSPSRTHPSARAPVDAARAPIRGGRRCSPAWGDCAEPMASLAASARLHHRPAPRRPGGAPALSSRRPRLSRRLVLPPPRSDGGIDMAASGGKAEGSRGAARPRRGAAGPGPASGAGGAGGAVSAGLPGARRGAGGRRGWKPRRGRAPAAAPVAWRLGSRSREGAAGEAAAPALMALVPSAREELGGRGPRSCLFRQNGLSPGPCSLTVTPTEAHLLVAFLRCLQIC